MSRVPLSAHRSLRGPIAVRRGRRAAAALGLMVVVGAPHTLAGQAPRRGSAPNPLHQLDDAIEALAQRVSPSVVQIMVTGYGSAETGDRKSASDVVGLRQVIGSGVIVDTAGYILTNAHVVSGAEKIEVIVPQRPSPGAVIDSSSDGRGTTYQAQLVGTAREIDLALLKIDARGLQAISIGGPKRPVRQGEVVFAFGSPEGLRNTITMGVVSAVARQPDPDSPLVYIQTDTPINPGNSGGALVDSDGELVGINTFILSTSGGNQGLGFAIPSSIVAFAYPQLLKFGRVHKPSMQALLQTITPDLAAGLHLARSFGVIVSDVVPGGPAEKADLRVQDIIVNVDGTPIDNLPLLAHCLLVHKGGGPLQVEVLRGTTRVKLQISLIDEPPKANALADRADPEQNLVRPLSLLGITIDIDLARSLPPLRIPMGVVVAARTLGSRTADIALQTGDVIHAVNGATVTTLQGLRDLLAAQRPGDAIVLQIERYGQLIYVSFTL